MQAYARWAPRYPACPHNLLMTLEQAAVLALLPAQIDSAADLACGTGRYARLLHDRHARGVLALDASPDMLQQAAGAPARLVRGDLRAIPLASASFDVAVCGLAIGDVPDLTLVVAEFARVLRPGGCVVYSDLHPRGARAGWARTFEDAAGDGWTVRQHIHDLSDHAHACRSAGLVIDAVGEPAIDVEHPYRGWPAALVVRARRLS